MTVPGGPPFGSFDVAVPDVGGVYVAGWAIDPDTRSPIDVHVYVDDRGLALRSTGNRPDVGAAYPAYGADHGYSERIPTSPGPHTVCAYAINVGTGANSLLGCRRVTVPGGPPFGSFDVAVPDVGGVYVAGWAIDPDTRSPIDVHVYVDDHGLALRSTGNRPDVGAAYPAYGADHGYAERIPTSPGPHTVCAYAINVGTGANSLLGCRRVTVR